MKSTDSQSPRSYVESVTQDNRAKRESGLLSDNSVL